uniref:Uncharacterized protein n=1 Tax=Arundo donax TaxID=35708 RepID=A0A0A8XXK7_ARUDO
MLICALIFIRMKIWCYRSMPRFQLNYRFIMDIGK